MSIDDDSSPPEQTPVSSQVLRGVMVFEALVGAFAVVVGWLVECRPDESVGWTWTAAGQGLFAAAPMLLLFWLTLRFPVGPLGPLKEFVEEHVLPLFVGARWWELAIVSVLAGVSEEFLFRGVIQQGLARLHEPPWGTVFGIAVASLMFGLAHALTATYAVLAGLISVYLGWLFVEADNLLVPIVAHAAYDFVALVCLLRHQPLQSRDS